MVVTPGFLRLVHRIKGDQIMKSVRIFRLLHAGVETAPVEPLVATHMPGVAKILVAGVVEPTVRIPDYIPRSPR